MNTQATQFYVAIVAIVAVAILAMTALICAAFGNQNSAVVTDVLMLLVGGLVATVGAASAYLFRLNGKATMK